MAFMFQLFTKISGSFGVSRFRSTRLFAWLGFSLVLVPGLAGACIKDQVLVVEPLAVPPDAAELYYWARGCQDWQEPEAYLQPLLKPSQGPIAPTWTRLQRRAGYWAFTLPRAEHGDIVYVRHHGQTLAAFCAGPDQALVSCYASWAAR